MTTIRASVSAFGSCCCTLAVAAGADTLQGYAPPGLRARGRFRPVRGTRQVGAFGRAAVFAPGAVVARVALPRAGGLDLRALVPLVVARDRGQVRAGPERGPPHAVVRRAAKPGDRPGVAGGATRGISGADGRRAQQALRMRLVADAFEHEAAIRVDVVRVDPLEAAGLRKADERRLR